MGGPSYEAVLAAQAKLKVAHAQWKLSLVPGSANEWQGSCQKCGTVVPAVQLTLKQLPFGRGENWICQRCVNAPKEG